MTDFGEEMELPDVLTTEELDEMLNRLDVGEVADVPDPDLTGIDFPDLDELPEPELSEDFDKLLSDYD